MPDEPGETAEPAQKGEPGGKRVSWVELYFDLIFVFAVGETAHVMVADPRWGGFGRALVLFILLWWTWIGFVVLCNRHYEDRVSHRLFVLAGTLPSAVAAVEVHAAADGHALAFLLALAGARLVLALAFAFAADKARQVTVGYGVSAAIFAGAAFTPGPWRYPLLAFALIQEAGFLLLRNGQSARGAPSAGPAPAGRSPCGPCSSRPPTRLARWTPPTWPSASDS